MLRDRLRAREARRIAIRGLEALRARDTVWTLRRVAVDEREPALLRGACIDALAALAAA